MNAAARGSDNGEGTSDEKLEVTGQIILDGLQYGHEGPAPLVKQSTKDRQLRSPGTETQDEDKTKPIMFSPSQRLFLFTLDSNDR